MRTASRTISRCGALLAAMLACAPWPAPVRADNQAPVVQGAAPKPFSGPDDPIYPDIYQKYAPQDPEELRQMMIPLLDLKADIEKRGLGKADLGFLATGSDIQEQGEVVTTEATAEKRKIVTTVRLPEWPRRDGDTWKADIWLGTNLDMFREEIWEVTLQKQGRKWKIVSGRTVSADWKKYRHGSVVWSRYTVNSPFEIVKDQLRISMKSGEVFLGWIPGELGRRFLIQAEGEITATLTPPTRVERDQMKRRVKSETFTADVRSLAIHYQPEGLAADFDTWPLTESPDKGRQVEMASQWFKLFANVGENRWEFDDRYSPLYTNPEDLLCVMRAKGGPYFYRNFAYDPEWTEEIVFGEWLSSAIGKDVQAEMFTKNFTDANKIGLLAAVNSVLVSPRDEGVDDHGYTQQMLENFRDSLQDETGAIFTEPELVNMFMQVASGRPHWGEDQAFGRWRLPEMTDARSWVVWCQYERPEDRAMVPEEAAWTTRRSLLDLQRKQPMKINHIQAIATVDTGSGVIHVDGRLDLTIFDQNLTTLQFLLNPQMKVQSLADKDGRTYFFEADRNRLNVRLPGKTTANERRALFFYLTSPATQVYQSRTNVSVVNWVPDLGYLSRKTFDLLVQVPSNFEVAATGRLVSRFGDKKNTWFQYRADTPILGPSFMFGPYKYRATIASGVKVDPEVAPDGVKIGSYSTEEPIKVVIQVPSFLGDASFKNDLTANASRQLDSIIGTTQDVDVSQSLRLLRVNSTPLLKGLSEILGPYPFSHFSLVEPDYQVFSEFGLPGVVLVDPLMIVSDAFSSLNVAANRVDPTFNDAFLAHEMSRQWWGYQVTHSSPHDRWITTGLCQITAAWVCQTIHGDSYYKNTLKRWEEGARRVDDEAPLWLGYRRVDLLDSYHLLYHKAAFVWHMLRMMLPIDAATDKEVFFEAILRRIVHEYTSPEKVLSTPELQELIERTVTPETLRTLFGREDLSWFFRQWVYGTTVPKLAFEVTYVSATKDRTEVKVKLTQAQDGEPFVLPADFQAKVSGKWETRRVVIDRKEQEFTFIFPGTVRALSFDRFHHLLCEVKGIDR